VQAAQQRLGDITAEDAKKEGFESLEELRKAWVKIYGSWNPGQIVTVYDFQLAKKGKPSPAKESPQP